MNYWRGAAFLCATAAVAYMFLSAPEHVPAPPGMGTGVHDCGPRVLRWGYVCTERPRCGPRQLAYIDEPIECQGIIAVCAEWATLKTRNVLYYAAAPSIRVGGQLVRVEAAGWLRDANALHEFLGLAKFCAVALNRTDLRTCEQ